MYSDFFKIKLEKVSGCRSGTLPADNKQLLMFSTISLFSQLENSGPEMHGLYSFTIISEAREIHLAAGSEEEKYKWMEVKIKKISHGVM